MKKFHLEHETMRACHTNIAYFVHIAIVCRFVKIEGIFQVFSTLGQIIDVLKVNRFGQTYRTGVALDQDMRKLIVDRILQECGDRVIYS